MFQEVIFRSTTDFSAAPLRVVFDQGINVIIGPKGGGKSTLFDLLVGLKNNCLYKNVKQALAEFGLEFEKAYKFGGEVIMASQLKEIKTQPEKERQYENRYDVIYQDDPIKKDLTKFSDIQNNKRQYLQKQIQVSDDVLKLINRLDQLYESMHKLHAFDEAGYINWSNTMQMDQFLKEDHLKLLLQIQHKNNDFPNLIKREMQELKRLINLTEDYAIALEQSKQASQINFTNVFLDPEFMQLLEIAFNKINFANQEFLQLLKQRQKTLSKIQTCYKIFVNTYDKILAEINKNLSFSSTLELFHNQALNHFKAVATEIITLKKGFETLFNEPISLTIANEANQKGSLTYEIANPVELNSDLISELLKVIFHSPGASKEDLTKWLKSLGEKGVKDFSAEKLRKKMAELLIPYVKVLVDDGKDYETLSLGQRSIYGFKYKFHKSIEQDLFLDQPEDNLDNNTVAAEILPLLKLKTNQQVFIVTHNANIGILTNPKRIIVANLINSKQPYHSIDIIQEMNQESGSYLEGGQEYLRQRFKKIIEGEN